MTPHPAAFGGLLLLLAIAACGGSAPPSGTDAPASDAAGTAPASLGDAQAGSLAALLPRTLDEPWQITRENPQPSPRQLERWVRELGIEGGLVAAMTVAEHAQRGTAIVMAFEIPERTLKPGSANGLALADRWIETYACGPPATIGMADAVITTIRAGAGCRPHYLLPFTDQLVVVEDAVDRGQAILEPPVIEPIVAAVLALARGP